MASNRKGERTRQSDVKSSSGCALFVGIRFTGDEERNDALVDVSTLAWLYTANDELKK